MLTDSSLGEFLLVWRASSVNGPSVKLAGLKARGPALLGLYASSSTVNYFTLIIPSGGSSSCSIMQTKWGGLVVLKLGSFCVTSYKQVFDPLVFWCTVKYSKGWTQETWGLLILLKKRAVGRKTSMCVWWRASIHKPARNPTEQLWKSCTSQSKSNQTGRWVLVTKAGSCWPPSMSMCNSKTKATNLWLWKNT